MTLTRFVTKNAFRNKRRSILTVLSIAFSLLLLTFMMTLWHTFALDEGSAESAQRLVVRHRVSLTFTLPSFYREKIRSVPGVVAVVPSSWFQGVYKDQKPENFFPRFATDPEEFLKVYRDIQLPDDQVKAWQRDRQGVIVDDTLAKKYGWKLGDRIFIQGDIYPLNLELNIRGIFHSSPDNQSAYFNAKYLEEADPGFNGKAGTFGILADNPSDVSKIASAVDDMFRNSPQPTKTESEKAFGLEFVAMMGNVKAFILLICSAVVFATLLVSANTIAMSIRERTREVAVLKTLGFTRWGVLGLFVSEAVALALVGGFVGASLAKLLVFAFVHGAQMTFFPLSMTFEIWLLGLVISGAVGLVSAALPSYHASQVNIVDGLRHIG
ncbi:MAG TPA: FtsX-like permease family protein [Candidatus Sulfotelmatobacter sp.]|nr:FtsX-like permease family protein [Candidatus Sulfotelmatobacter sp.]